MSHRLRRMLASALSRRRAGERRRRMALGLFSLLAVGVLAGCGKKGAPSAPGPASEIAFPRQYPAP